MGEGLLINAIRLNNLRYAEDIKVCSDNIQDPQKIMDRITDVSALYGLGINANKTQIMIKKTSVGQTS